MSGKVVRSFGVSFARMNGTCDQFVATWAAA